MIPMLREDLIHLNARIERTKKRLPSDQVACFEEMAIEGRIGDADRLFPTARYSGPPSPAMREERLSSVTRTDKFVDTIGSYGQGADAMYLFLERLDTDREQTRLSIQGILTGYRDLTWLTTTDALSNALRQSRHPPAEIGRAVLGLAHYGSNVDLTQLAFPTRFFSEVRVPTFADGADHECFCVWFDGDHEHGYTWRMDRHTRGLPEVVHPPITLNRRIDPAHLGRTTGHFQLDRARLLKAPR
jgi:hypothetical protein